MRHFSPYRVQGLAIVASVMLAYSGAAQSAIQGPFLGKETTIPDSGEVRLIAFPEKADAYLWSTGWRTPVIFVQDSGWVWVDITNGGITIRDSIYIRLPCIYFPSSYSPNRERYNDCFQATLNCNLVQYSIRIYDRWGRLVHASTDKLDCWDGKYEGSPLPDGTNYYICEWEKESSENPSDPLAGKRTGTFTLMR